MRARTRSPMVIVVGTSDGSLPRDLARLGAFRRKTHMSRMSWST